MYLTNITHTYNPVFDLSKTDKDFPVDLFFDAKFYCKDKSKPLQVFITQVILTQDLLQFLLVLNRDSGEETLSSLYVRTSLQSWVNIQDDHIFGFLRMNTAFKAQKVSSQAKGYLNSSRCLYKKSDFDNTFYKPENFPAYKDCLSVNTQNSTASIQGQLYIDFLGDVDVLHYEGANKVIVKSNVNDYSQYVYIDSYNYNDYVYSINGIETIRLHLKAADPASICIKDPVKRVGFQEASQPVYVMYINSTDVNLACPQDKENMEAE